MSVTFTVRANNLDNVDAASFTTASFTPTASSTLIAFVFDSIATGTAPRSVPSGHCSDWTELNTSLWSSSPGVRRCGVWRGTVGSSPSNAAITWTCNDAGSGTTSTATGWVVIELGGHHVTAPVRQVVAPSTTGLSGTTQSITLASPVDANSRPLSFFVHRGDELTTPRTNWTEIADHQCASPSTGMEAQSRTDAFETTASASWATSGNYFGIALEIAEASAPDPPVYPTIASSASTSATAGPVNCNMPSGIVAGNLLIAGTSADAAPTVTPGGSEGWTNITDATNGSVVRLKLLAKIAAGGDTLNLTLGASQDTATHIMRITDHGVTNVATDIEVGTAATGLSVNPDPPSVTPAANAANLIIAFAAEDDDDNVDPYAPTDYTPQAQVESAQSTSSCMLQVAYRKLVTSGAVNPGTFTMAASEDWVTQTICIPPASTGQLIDCQRATATIAGVAGTITEGTVTKNAQQATATITGQSGARNAGPITKNEQQAALTIVGVPGTLSIVTVKPAQVASATIVGVPGTITEGAITKSGQVAALAVTGIQGTITEGVATKAIQPALATIAGQAGTITLGAATKSAQVGLLTIVGVPGTLAVGTATKTAQVAALTITGVPGSTATATTINCQPATLALSGLAGTASFGIATKSAQVGVLAITPQAGSITRGLVTRTAQVGALALSGVSGANTLGTATKSASPGALSVAGVAGKLELRVACTPAVITLAGQQGSRSFGAITKSGQSATLTIEGRPGSTSGAVTLDAQVGVLTISAISATRQAGAITKSAQVGALAVQGESGAITEGAVTKTAQVGALTIAGVPGSMSTFGAPQTKNCQAASLTLTAQPGSITVEATVISCQAAVVTIVGTANVTSSHLTFNASTGFVSISGQDGNRLAGPLSKSAQIGALTITGRNGQPVTGQGQPQTVECSPALLQLTAGSGVVSLTLTVQAGIALLTLVAIAGQRSVTSITKQGDPGLLTLLAVAGIPLNKAIAMAGFTIGGALRYPTSTGTIRLDSDDGSLVHANSQGGIESSTDDGRIVHSTSVGSMA